MKIKIKLQEIKRIIRPKILSIEPEEETEDLNKIKEDNKNILLSSLPQALVSSCIKQIPILSQIPIIKKVASGTQGTVFKFPDDRLLKIYIGSYVGTIEAENDRYEKLKSKVFSGSATKADLLIYDHGIGTYKKLVSSWDGNRYQETVENHQYGWVIMGRVIPLDDYFDVVANFDFTKKRDLEKAFDMFSQKMNSFAYDYLNKNRPATVYIDPTNIEDVLNHQYFKWNILDSGAYARANMELGEEFVNNLIQEMLRTYFDNDKNYAIFNDLHSGNIGVRKLYDPVPVIFDV